MSYYRQGPTRPGGGTIQIGVPQLTPMVKNLIIACVAVFLLQLVWKTMALYLGVVPAQVARGWLWQPVSYMFLHGGPFHLLFNMLTLWMFGGELERFWGSKAFLRFYLVCGGGGGVAAALMGLLPQANPNIPTIGASGAIFGLFMGYGMVFAERTVLFMMIFPIKARTMAIIMFALSFFYLVGQTGSGISHIAHLGGGVTGFLYLKRAWRVGAFYRELRWKMQRRKFKVMTQEDDDNDRYIH